jgi:glycosyltransferase involved in cell wall biosynthesis
MIINDPSYRSLTLIHEKVSNLLGHSVFLPDLKESIDPEGEHQHVLATGLYFRRVFEINYWPKNDFYLYCLSPSVKEVLVKLLSFDPEFINVIPRYTLIPPLDLNTPFQLSNDFTIVFAGRVSPQKNIEFLIMINFYFQLMYSEKIKLLILGSFDNEHHFNALNIYDKNYEVKIHSIINSLPWPGEKPTIIKGLNQFEWIDRVPKNSIYLSVSNLISEDFSMACAQVQNQLSIPLILPQWGAFKDIIGENVRFYHSELIAASNESFVCIAEKSKNFVQLFIQKKLFQNKSNKLLNMELMQCAMINRTYLQEKIELNILKWGRETEEIIKGNLSQFTKSRNGQSFFNEYTNIFSK